MRLRNILSVVDEDESPAEADTHGLDRVQKQVRKAPTRFRDPAEVFAKK